MLFYIASLFGFDNILNLFRYISFRAGGAILTSLIIALVTGPYVIRWLRAKQKTGQPIREDGPQSHLLTKKGTPTMGGSMILLSLSISTLLWMDLRNMLVWACLLVTLAFGFIGFIDDYAKVRKNNHDGLSGRTRLILEFIIAGLAVAWIDMSTDTVLYLPFVKDSGIDLGWGHVLLGAFIVTGFGNAVNLTDGLDGLATMPTIIAAGSFALIAYLVGNAIYAHYLGIHFVQNAGELTIFCTALIGAGLGFLWFNAPPAAIFMGDTGSLALGGALGMIAVATDHEIVLLVIGGLFVLETASVIIQVASFKLTGKRVFRMAPIHHHFEQKGWAESTVVVRFWIIALALALIGLSTLKLR